MFSKGFALFVLVKSYFFRLLLQTLKMSNRSFQCNRSNIRIKGLTVYITFSNFYTPFENCRSQLISFHTLNEMMYIGLNCFKEE